MQQKKSVVKLWFRFLKAAQKKGLPIAWEKYQGWGAPEQIESMSFNAWWKATGTKLFPREAKLNIVDSGDVVVVSIPKRFTAKQLRGAIQEVTPYLDKRLRKGAGTWEPDGKVRYDDFAVYLRLLEIELSASYRHKPMREKLEKLQSVYEGHRRRIDKQNQNIKAAAGGSKRVHVVRKPRTLPNLQLRSGYLWLKKANAMAKDVAEGKFPGRGYRKQ